MQHVMRRPAEVVSLTVFVLAMAGAPQLMAHSHPNHLRGGLRLLCYRKLRSRSQSERIR